MSETRSIKTITAMMEGWTESAGKKPRQWAKIPVTILRTFCRDIRETHDKERAELAGLLSESIPFLESELPILRRAANLAGSAGPVVAAALNKSNELESVIARAKRAVGP